MNIKNLTHQILVFLTEQILKKFKRQYLKSTESKMSVILVAGNIGKSSQTLFLSQAFEKIGYSVWSGTTQNKNRNTLTGLIITLGEFEYNLEQVGLIPKIGFILKAIQVWFFKNWDFSPRPNILIYEIGVDRSGEMADYIQVFEQIDWVVISNFGPEHTVGFPEDFDDRSFELSKTNLADLYDLNPEFNLSVNLPGKLISNTLKNCYLEQLKLLTIAKNYILPADFELSGLELILKQNGNLKAIKLDPSRQSDYTLICSGFQTPINYLLPKSFARQMVMTRVLAQNFGGTETQFQQILDTLVLPNGRFGLFDGINQSKIADGSYNSDPASLDSFLELLLELRPKKLNYLVLGEMRELGNDTIEVHQRILTKLESISKHLEIKVLLLGATWLDCDLSPLSEITQHFNKVGEIIADFKSKPPQNHSWFWIKGSQNTIFLESLVESLLENPVDESKLARRGRDWDLVRDQWCR